MDGIDKDSNNVTLKISEDNDNNSNIAREITA